MAVYGDCLSCREASPDGVLAQKELAAQLARALDRLPFDQRTAIVLRFVADLPEADIALAMGVRRGTVSSTLALARRRLSELLQDDVDTDPFEEVSHA